MPLYKLFIFYKKTADSLGDSGLHHQDNYPDDATAIKELMTVAQDDFGIYHSFSGTITEGNRDVHKFQSIRQ